MKTSLIKQSLVFVFVLTSVGVAQTPTRIQNIVSAGNLASMRWPSFPDYRTSLQRFYGPANYAPAWVEEKSPSPQALAIIGLLQNAWKKGLEPEDYDSSRWNERLQALQAPSADPSDFDVALTVCTMRYISDLRIGRINPHHFKFGLDIEHKKYDLAQFVRERILKASDISSVIDSVESPFSGYRRTEQALERYRAVDSFTASSWHMNFIHEVRQELSTIKLVVIGMDLDPQHFLELIRGGIVGYLAKDASSQEVIAAVRIVARGAQYAL